MTSNKRREIIGGLVFFVCAAVYYNMAFSIRQFQDGIVSSDFIPKVYGIIMMVLSALQILFGMWNRTPDKEGAKIPLKEQLVSVLTTFALLIAYVLLLKPVGFVIMSTFFIFTMTFLLYPRDKGNNKAFFLKIALIAAVFSTSVYVLFVYGFALTLPAGILEI